MTDWKHRWMLSGGLASGKSTVRWLLEGHGVSTIDSDSVGHQVLEPDGEAFRDVSERFPQVVVEGRIDRRRLGEVVFSDEGALRELEGITHPFIFGRIGALVEELDGVVVVEIPLLKSLGDDWRRIVVDVEEDVQVQRALERGSGEEDVRARLASQPGRAEWLAEADVVIPNHTSLADLEPAVAVLVPHL